MLNLDAGFEVESVIVYQDYSDRTRFYYAPKSPRLSVENGQPMFQLLIYRDIEATATDSSGGGFLAMTTDLGVPGLDRVREAISSRFGVQANLAPLPVKSGSVRVIALDSGRAGAPGATQPRFVEDLVASGTPSLYGDQRAVFTAELSKKGAVLMKAALEGGGATPVVAIYDLRFVGLLPAYNVKITIKFSQSYQHLRSRSQMNTLWFKTDIDQEVESLRKSGAIKIEEVVYETESKEQTSARAERLNALAKDLAQWTFFKPGLDPGKVLAADRGTLQAYDSTTDLSKITAGLTNTSRAALTGVGATEDVGTPRRPGAGVATDALETPATTPPAGGTGATQPTPAAEPAQPMTTVEAWNRAGRPQGAFLLRSLEQDERQEIVYELNQVAAVERSIAPQGQIRMLEGAVGLRGRILEVDLKADFFKTIGGKVSTNADLAALGIASMSVKLRYGVKDNGNKWKDEHEIALGTAGTSGTYRFSVDRIGTREVEHQVVINYRPNAAIGFESSSETSPWKSSTTRDLDINPAAYSSMIPVRLVTGLVDWNVVRQIQARVEYRDAVSGIQAADTKILQKDTAAADVRIRPKDPNVRDVTVTANFFYADDTTEARTFTQSGDEPFVINQSPDATTMVDLRLEDKLARYKRVTVQLGRPKTATEVLQTVTLGDATLEGKWSFRRDGPQDALFQYRVTSFMKDGAIKEGEWQKTDNPLVIVGDRTAGLLEVQVMCLGTPADGGFRLAKLELHYPDAPAWADAKSEVVFKTGTEEFTWRVPKVRADAVSYVYTVTWFGKDGTKKTTGPLTVKDEILLLDPLAVG